MKTMKKLSSLLLALFMILAMSVPAFAAEGNLTGGSITIDNAVPGQTYNAYQILYLESYSTDAAGNATGAYAYKANSAWREFINSSAIKDIYLKVDDQGYVTWVKDADPVAFAKLAQAEATKQGSTITADATAIATAAAQGATYSTVKFENLKLGYYLVDTTLGTLCSLDTTNPNVTMQEKNEVPRIKKEVKEDSTNDWGESNTAQIGDTVNFKTTIYAKPGAQNYVMHDVMSEGLTLISSNITVTAGTATLTAGTEYTLITSGLSDGCDFEIAFEQTYLDDITKDTEIVVTYSAILNDNAVISPDANTNKTKLDYGDDSETVWDETETYSFSFDIVKTKSESSEGSGSYELLDGAEFALYNAQTGGSLIPLVKDGNNYRVATITESTANGFKSATIVAKGGQATVIGLDANTTYWLEETKQPDGYNKLDGRVEVRIEDSNISTTLTDASTDWEDGNGGVHIINKTGAELPTTGGMGTTIFYVVGSILLGSAVILLIAKKRMGAEK